MSQEKHQRIEEDFKNEERAREELDQKYKVIQRDFDELRIAHAHLKASDKVNSRRGHLAFSLQERHEKEMQDCQQKEDALRQAEIQVEHLSNLLTKKETALREIKSGEQQVSGVILVGHFQ